VFQLLLADKPFFSEMAASEPGGVTTRPGFLFSVTPLDVTWRPLRRACHERLFSSTGDIAGDKRTCLLAENLEHLVFLKANVM